MIASVSVSKPVNYAKLVKILLSTDNLREYVNPSFKNSFGSTNATIVLSYIDKKCK